MFDRLKKLLGRASSPASFSDEDYDRWYELKRRGLEYVLGPMYEMVSHGVIPFFLGGRLDIYFFPCLLYTSPSPRDRTRSRMPSSA